MKQTKKIAAIITFMLLALIYINPVYGVASTYNLRDYININLKEQGETGACWALAMSTTFETNMSLKNKTRYEISARHMDYATSQSFTNGETNKLGFAKEVNTGGTGEIALAYLTNGSGPVPESEMPFSSNFDTIDINEIQNKTIEYQVTKWVSFPQIIKKSATKYVDDEGNEYTTEKITQIRNQVKEHIIENGAVYAGVNAAVGFANYYNRNTYAYNCNDYTKATDHAVVVIGWDDTYSKDNFKENCKPTTDGAWIVQNSWGNDKRLNNGTFYVSYEDAIIETGMFGIVYIQKKDYTNIYQYDELGRNQYFEINGKDEAYGANVFKRDKTNQEYITQVGISTYIKVDCEIYINPKDETFSKDKLTKVAEATIEPGYTNVNLGTPIGLTGEKFAVVVKYKKADKTLGITTISNYEIENEQDNPYSNVKSEPGESYMGITLANMKDLYQPGTENTNICIKAFTKVEEETQTQPSTPQLKGDIDGNGKVDIVDLSILQMHMVKIQLLPEETKGDIDGNGKIDITDLSMLMMILVHLI